MAAKSQSLTTSEFASEAGIAAAKVSKLIRDGKIEAEKKSGKWMIKPSELQVARDLIKKAKPASKKAAAAKNPASPQKARPQKKKATTTKPIPLGEFVSMTYLTANGVKEWLRGGRLTGRQDDSGEWMIDAANLELADVKRLVR